MGLQAYWQGSRWRPGYPTFDQWTTIIDETWAVSAAALVGAPLDPDGRLHIEAIHPQPEGWSEGDRVVWCGVPCTQPRPDGSLTPVSVSIRG